MLTYPRSQIRTLTVFETRYSSKITSFGVKCVLDCFWSIDQPFQSIFQHKIGTKVEIFRQNVNSRNSQTKMASESAKYSNDHVIKFCPFIGPILLETSFFRLLSGKIAHKENLSLNKLYHLYETTVKMTITSLTLITTIEV